MMTQATMSSSSAASIIVAAAEGIQFTDPHSILQRLEKEAIKEDWQLEYLDSVQWQALEVPMGLVSSIRRCLEERKRSRSSSPTDTRSPVPPSRSYPIPRIQSIFMPPKSETNYAHSELETSLHSKSSVSISLDGRAEDLPFSVSSKSNNFQDSLSTLFPPSMPTRKSSHNLPECSHAHSELMKSLRRGRSWKSRQID
jgi:hypothetical protein